MAERVGFEPTCRLPDNTLSRRARYDHFGTSPSRKTRVRRTLNYSARSATPPRSAAPPEQVLRAAPSPLEKHLHQSAAFGLAHARHDLEPVIVTRQLAAANR